MAGLARMRAESAPREQTLFPAKPLAAESKAPSVWIGYREQWPLCLSKVCGLGVH
jgi:hypothetical protein